MAFTLYNGTTTYTLPACAKDGIAFKTIVTSSIRRMYSGRLRARVRNEHYEISIFWPKLTVAERATLRAAYDGCANLWSTLTLPNGETFTVRCDQNGFQDSPWFDWADTPLYDVTLVFEEQS